MLLHVSLPVPACPYLCTQRRMSAEVNPSLVNWLTSMMSMRLHVILEHNPVTENLILHYVIYAQVRTTTVTKLELQTAKKHLCINQSIQSLY